MWQQANYIINSLGSGEDPGIRNLHFPHIGIVHDIPLGQPKVLQKQRPPNAFKVEASPNHLMSFHFPNVTEPSQVQKYPEHSQPEWI